MKNVETITVIIPVYNAGKMLEECLRSVLAQSYSWVELILVDDGSTDGSGTVCDCIAASNAWIRVFHQKNQGVSAARNLGLSQAKGRYITFLDADDIIPTDYLEILYDCCQNADIAVCDVVSVKDGRELTRFTHPTAVLSQREALNFLLRRRRINSGPYAKLFRREVVDGLTFPPLKAYEDILFVRDAFCRADKITVTDRTEYRYIQNTQGAMSGFVKMPSQDIIRATENLMDFIGARKDLLPETFYVTASHLMQYVIAVAGSQTKEAKCFIGAARSVYLKYLFEICKCSAFPWKEKIAFLLFVCKWLYHDKKLTRI